jgi:flagellar biosynthesis GTPase FlhF
MKNSKKSAKTKTSNTNKNANPQVSKKTKKQNPEMDEQKIQEEKMQEEKNEQRKRVNALYPPMQKAFEEMQKEIQDAEEVEININCIEKYGAKITTLDTILNSEDIEIEYAVDKLKPRGEISMIYGGSGVGFSIVLNCSKYAACFLIRLHYLKDII